MTERVPVARLLDSRNIIVLNQLPVIEIPAASGTEFAVGLVEVNLLRGGAGIRLVGAVRSPPRTVPP